MVVVVVVVHLQAGNTNQEVLLFTILLEIIQGLISLICFLREAIIITWIMVHIAL